MSVVGRADNTASMDLQAEQDQTAATAGEGSSTADESHCSILG